jgi:hypothetical protein
MSRAAIDQATHAGVGAEPLADTDASRGGRDGLGGECPDAGGGFFQAVRCSVGRQLAGPLQSVREPAQRRHPLQQATYGFGHPARDVVIDIGAQQLQVVSSHLSPKTVYNLFRHIIPVSGV